MFFKAIDRIFEQLKYILSMIILCLIALASIFFIYWLLFSAKIEMPGWLNTFIWFIVDFFAQGFKGTPLYKDIIPVLPVLTSGVFIIITYFANCLMLFLENNHQRYHKSVDNYRINLEKTINSELQKDFINELKRINFMLVKIKVVATKHTSYLTAATDEAVDIEKLENEIEQRILAQLTSEIIVKKGYENGSLYFLTSDLSKTKDFFEELVLNSRNIICEYVRPKLDIGFYCGADLLNGLSEFDEKSVYLDRIMNLKISNKILITPKFKLYFDNIMPKEYKYSVMGEYNLSGVLSKNTYTLIHAIQRKNQI